jgi:hypothetical protein
MPYIKLKDRIELDKIVEKFPATMSWGEINYVITKILLSQDFGKRSYSSLNSIIGVLECVKQEFYRRAAAPYEDEKIEENGDVY